MFDPNAEAQDLNCLPTKPDSTSPLFTGEGTYGLTNKQFDQLQSGSGLNSGFDIDPWSDEAVANAAKHHLFANDNLTGEEDAAQNGLNQEGGAMEFGAGNAEINEVVNLLNKSIYKRDDLTGTNYHQNNEWVTDIGRGDSCHNAQNVGTIVYRKAAQINGSIGKTFSGVRDEIDWYKFRVGKTGTIELEMTGLSENLGLEVYNDQGQLLDSSGKEGAANESISKYLAKGDYFARVYSYKQNPSSHQHCDYSLNIERKADERESFWEKEIFDASIENAALNSIKFDDCLSREDVIGVLNSSRDMGSIDSNELTDLRNFYNYAINTTQVRDDVKVLSEKVLFGNRSNRWYTGSDSIRDTLGNLAAGTSSTNMSLLIGKHFLGTDRPAIERKHSGTYTRAGGTLFKNGVSHDDIDQGYLGTCYFLSALAGTANDKPSVINNMFTENDDGTWTVKFTTNGDTDYVTVDRMMATGEYGHYLYANDGSDGGIQNKVAANNELWVALAEKAYAQLNESNEIGQDGTNSYGGIRSGWSFDATTHLTGIGVTSGSAITSGADWQSWRLSSAELQALVNSNRVVTVGGFDASADGGYVGDTNVQSGVRRHAYAITGYNPANGRYSIRNPWDKKHLSLTHGQLAELEASIHWSNS